MASCSERNLTYEHLLTLSLSSLFQLSVTHFHPCSTFVNSPLAFVFTVFAMRVQPRHVRGSKQRRDQRKEQISEHTALWVTSTHKWTEAHNTVLSRTKKHLGICAFSWTDDHSRVLLSHVDSRTCSDYINASYIDVSKFFSPAPYCSWLT